MILLTVPSARFSLFLSCSFFFFLEVRSPPRASWPLFRFSLFFFLIHRCMLAAFRFFVLFSPLPVRPSSPPMVTPVYCHPLPFFLFCKFVGFFIFSFHFTPTRITAERNASRSHPCLKAHPPLCSVFSFPLSFRMGPISSNQRWISAVSSVWMGGPVRVQPIFFPLCFKCFLFFPQGKS